MAEETIETQTTTTEEQAPDFSKMTEDQQWEYLAKNGPPEKKEEEAPKEEEQEEEVEEDKPQEEQPKEEEQTEELSDANIDEYIKNSYAEAYEINSKEELDEVLETLDEVVERNESLQKELDELKGTKKEPEFASDLQKSAYNFIKDYDPSQFSDKLETWSRLQGMDVEGSDKRAVMEESFILKHPELTRSQAQRKFSRDYDRKFAINRDNFDSDKAYEDAKEDADIDLISEFTDAKKHLKEVQQQFKINTAEKREDKSTEVNPQITRSIEQNVNRLEKFEENFKTITWSPTDKETDNFTFEFNAEQRKQIHSVVATWIKNPSMYNKEGELNSPFDIDEAYERAARFLYGDKIMDNFWKHAEQVISGKRVDEIAKQKPTRVSRTAGAAATTNLSEDQQWDLLIKKKKGITA